MSKKALVIGAGIAGIASALRLSAKGYKVKVFEKNGNPGGKINEINHQGFRFDTGPSLFTLPQLVDELFLLFNEKASEHFNYQKLEVSCKYFWDDGTLLNAYEDIDKFAKEAKFRLGTEEQRIKDFLKKNKTLYELTQDIFINNSFHKLSNYKQPSHRKMLFHLHKLNAFTTMHNYNQGWFKNDKIVQLFDRYATYNGSNPYKTPATLNIISHLEHNIGAFFPFKGMYSIVTSLVDLAERHGVEFHYNSLVEAVIQENNMAKGIKMKHEKIYADIVVSDIDIVNLYWKLLPGKKIPRSQIKNDRSSSAMIFYWGIDKEFPGLELHNILFSNHYKAEFNALFKEKIIYQDPTVYIFISSKQVKGDAPSGKENWFVMINAPENIGQNWEKMVKESREAIIEKINRVMKTDIKRHIVFEKLATPVTIEKDTAAFGGSLYGLSSNGKFSAFLRHPNYTRAIKNLYFTGGSVHPGGGIPLCLSSAKIIDKEIDQA